MKPPLVSIIIPTFNAAATLARTLESLRRQSYRSTEVILVDGLSSDSTVTIARNYRDVVTTIISEQDRGQAHALNKGFLNARGDILCWLCADDEFLPDTLQHVVNHFSASPEVDIVTGACARVFPDGSTHIIVPPPNVAELIGVQYRIEQPSTFWRSRAMHGSLRLDESFHYAFDWDFFARLIRPPNQTLVLPDVMSKYHFSATNKTSTGRRPLVLELREVIRRHGPLDGRLADIFFFLYRRFDLAGCYDSPPSCTVEAGRRFKRVMARLERKYPKELLHLYNWNFASKQERQLVWYK
jgi:glycosyltransferase involved in cell wall biosynthesis